MKLCFDVKECEKLKVPVDTALYIASLYLGKLISSNTFQDVCARGLIEFDGFDLKREPINARCKKYSPKVENQVLSSCGGTASLLLPKG